MNQITALLVFLILGSTTQAETFLGVTSATNRLVVGTNEALVIHRFTGAISYQLVKDGSVFDFADNIASENRISPESPSALAGPCELVFTNVALLNFQRIVTSSIQTVVLPPAASVNTQTVSVASGRSIRIFRALPSALTYATGVGVSRGTNTINATVSFRANDEFTGPLDITFSGRTSGTTCLYSYVMTDEPQIVPQGVTVQSPTGAFQFLVEKSVDLTNWVPSVIQNLQGNQKAFYRLRITK
jgi:hypothetical protein